MYEYEWIPGALAPTTMVEEMAALYSEHYGVWGRDSGRDGKPVRLSVLKLRDWLIADSRIAIARDQGRIIGYAIAVWTSLPRHGVVSWVTQFVVHKDYRRQGVGKTLLFTIWHFSNHFAWGLVSANPYAVRALEKATRRRSLPQRIRRHQAAILNLGTSIAPYIHSNSELIVDGKQSRINSVFPLDHSNLDQMLAGVTAPDKPWLLGPLPEGWEWFAFTFQDQPPIALSEEELKQMLLASDDVTKRAYSRMLVKRADQLWAKHTEQEVEFIVRNCFSEETSSVLDFGCGRGRHTLELARRGLTTVGVDYVEDFIRSAKSEASTQGLGNAIFRVADCRVENLGQQFDAAICLYDVIGTYADDADNFSVLLNLARHLKPGGSLLLSVMNFELTARRAQRWFSINSEPQALLELEASGMMEQTGDVFDPEHYFIDRDTKLVYRKEQFSEGTSLPEELLVRDKRYTKTEIEHLCEQAGLTVEWARFVRAGKWDQSLAAESDAAKEILVLCTKAT